MLPQSFITQVKQTVDIVELVQKYTVLEKVSNGIWQGKCPHPEHDDQNPSFRVWEKEQSWACMVCHFGDKGGNNKGTDCFAFIQWIEDLNWKQAILKLAKDYRIPIPTEENQAAYNLQKRLAQSYQTSLHGQAFNYLIDRGLNKQDMLEWGLGFDGKRLDFPLYDRYKNILGFTKRYLNFTEESLSNKIPKYKNSPTTAIFNKSFYFYGIHNLNNKINEIRIAEGTFDVILPDKYGVKNIVATLGTAFTDNHVEIIKQLGKTPVFCLDGDKAGNKATITAISKLAKENIYAKVLVLPPSLDMADLANKYKYDLEAYINSNAVTYGYYLTSSIVNEYHAKVNELKMKLYPQVSSLIESIPLGFEKNIIKDFVREEINMNIE